MASKLFLVATITNTRELVETNPVALPRRNIHPQIFKSEKAAREMAESIVFEKPTVEAIIFQADLMVKSDRPVIIHKVWNSNGELVSK